MCAVKKVLSQRLTSLLLTLVVKKSGNRPTLVSISHTKMQVRKWIYIKVDKFVLVGCIGVAPFLGLLISATRSFMGLWLRCSKIQIGDFLN
jgi:hypothetical protein